MKVNNVKIYDFDESIVASGLPMLAEYNEAWIKNEIINLKNCADITENPHFKRMCRLANTPSGSGHANALSGIVVSMDVTATQVWWMQMERYHFVQIVSSMSKMHRLKEMLKNRKDFSMFNAKTDGYCADMVMTRANNGVMDHEQMIYSCPMGLELTARITTNYLQLKTMYNQRKNHKLQEWRDYCDFIKSLPFAQEFIIGKEN